jgi:hypothetical protein
MTTGRVGEMDRYRVRDLARVDRRLAVLFGRRGQPACRCTRPNVRAASAVVALNGVPLHFDHGHFTESGAAWVMRAVPAL